MAKPTKRILDWASGGNAVDPGASKEANGWFIAERPPAYWWNWILQSFGEWLSYFETETDIRLPVAFGTITSDGAGGADLSANSYGFTNPSLISNTFTLNFATAQASTDYFVVATVAGSGATDWFPVCNGKSTASISVNLYDLGTGAQIPLSTETRFVDIVVFGSG